MNKGNVITIDYNGGTFDISEIDTSEQNKVSLDGVVKKIKAQAFQVDKRLQETRKIFAKEVNEKQNGSFNFSFAKTEEKPKMTVIDDLPEEPVIEKTVSEPQIDFTEMMKEAEKINDTIDSIRESKKIEEATYQSNSSAYNEPVKSNNVYTGTTLNYRDLSYNIKSGNNTGDIAQQYRKKLENINKDTMYGQVLEIGVKKLDEHDLVISKIKDQIEELNKAVAELDAKISLARSDKQIAEGVLARFNIVDLGTVNNNNGRQIIEKLNSLLSQIKVTITQFPDLIGEQDGIISSLDMEKENIKAAIIKANDNLSIAEKAKKDTCREIGENLKKASDYDDNVKKTKEEQERSARTIEELELQRKKLRGGISIISTDTVEDREPLQYNRFYENDDISNKANVSSPEVLQIARDIIAKQNIQDYNSVKREA